MLLGLFLLMNYANALSLTIDVVIAEFGPKEWQQIMNLPVDEQWKEIQRLRSMPRETSAFDPRVRLKTDFIPEVTKSYRNVK
tara:strand:- start:382 stop:627 length:246 start_codon:yes stop_codon:yes gene_type:complete